MKHTTIRSILAAATATILIGALTVRQRRPEQQRETPPPTHHLPSTLPQTIWVDTTSAIAEPEDPSQLCPGWGPTELRLDATTFYSYTATTNTFLLSDARSPGGTAPHASVYTYDSFGTAGRSRSGGPGSRCIGSTGCWTSRVPAGRARSLTSKSRR